MGANHLSYNHAADYQWNVLSGMDKQVPKQNFGNLVTLDRTTAPFTPIPSATAPVLNKVRTDKEAWAQQQRVFSSSAYSSNINFAPHYARTKVAAPSFRRVSYQSQRFRSHNMEAGRLLGSNLKISAAAASASVPTRRNTTAPESLSTTGAVFVSMPLDHRFEFFQQFCLFYEYGWVVWAFLRLLFASFGLFIMKCRKLRS